MSNFYNAEEHNMKTQQTEHDKFIETIADGPTRRRNQSATPAQAQPENWEDLTEDQQDQWMMLANATAPQTSHSPLPWKCGRLTSAIVDAKGIEVAWKTTSTETQWQSDKAFIVRACNNAHRLADALSLLIRTVNDTLRHPTSSVQLQCLGKCAKDSCQALAQWEKAQ